MYESARHPNFKKYHTDCDWGLYKFYSDNRSDYLWLYWESDRISYNSFKNMRHAKYYMHSLCKYRILWMMLLVSPALSFRNVDHCYQGNSHQRCPEQKQYHCLKNKEGLLVEGCISSIWVPKGPLLSYHTVKFLISQRIRHAKGTYWPNFQSKFSKNMLDSCL